MESANDNKPPSFKAQNYFYIFDKLFKEEVQKHIDKHIADGTSSENAEKDDMSLAKKNIEKIEEAVKQKFMNQ